MRHGFTQIPRKGIQDKLNVLEPIVFYFRIQSEYIPLRGNVFNKRSGSLRVFICQVLYSYEPNFIFYSVY